MLLGFTVSDECGQPYGQLGSCDGIYVTLAPQPHLPFGQGCLLSKPYTL